jgi:hypothetical protein
LLCDVDSSAHIEGACAANALLKGLALDQFHRVKILACVLANSELVDGRDVLLSQRCGCAGFPHKAFAGVRAALSDVDFNDL